jgi:Ca2+-binding RTX toxin-like protein
MASGATPGNDILTATSSPDAFDGLDGFDFVSYANSTTGVRASLETSSFADGDAIGDTYANIEGLIGTSLDDVLDGNAGSNELRGGAGDDILFGGEGSDTLNGGGGFDGAYYNEATARVVVYLANDGINEGDAAGDVYIDVEDASGTAFDDILIGTSASNYLYGREGNDRLTGGLGADTMIGGSGDDTYFVDDLGDEVLEVDGEGTNDIVYTSVRGYIAPAFVEQIIFVDPSDPVPLPPLPPTVPDPGNPFIGDAGANLIVGDGGNNAIFGFGGNDTLKGAAGNDYLFGDTGNDRLEGGTGSDTLQGGPGNDLMIGGSGNDFYYINSSKDRVSESSKGGTDHVVSSISYILGSNLEHLSLLGTKNLSGTGNSLSNKITGNAGKNNLIGGAGNDTLDGRANADRMEGGTGNDRYFVDNAGDQVIEALGGGTDHVFSSISYNLTGKNVEKLTLIGAANRSGTGDAGANTLVGNVGNNSLNGAAGNDKIFGALGKDILTGGFGQDAFVFNTALGSTNVDRIRDFSVVDDRIHLEDRIFTGLGGSGGLSSSAFRTGGQAQDASDRIIYNKSTGSLLYDADGVGGAAAVQFAILSKGLTLGANDFLII